MKLSEITAVYPFYIQSCADTDIMVTDDRYHNELVRVFDNPEVEYNETLDVYEVPAFAATRAAYIESKRRFLKRFNCPLD